MWCWIKSDGSPENDRLRIGSEYGYMWLAILVSFCTYGTIAFKWFRQASFDQDRTLKRDAIAMGWYPLAYFVTVAPQSVIRFLQFQPQGHRPGHGWTILTSVLFSSGGALNVILWLWTGRRFGFSPEKEVPLSEPNSPRNVEMSPPPEDNTALTSEMRDSGVYQHSAGGPSFPPTPSQQSPTTPYVNNPYPYTWAPGSGEH